MTSYIFVLIFFLFLPPNKPGCFQFDTGFIFRSQRPGLQRANRINLQWRWLMNFVYEVKIV